MSHDFQQDIDAINRIASVETILKVVCRTTGMGFAAVARVTDKRWIACKVLDTIDFGLVPGGELKVETTICDEIRGSREAVVIDHVAKDEVYCGHPTPAMYGFQSYISMPIILSNGEFFGTLCAIDPRPAKVSAPEVVGMFKLFAELIALQLEAGVKLAFSEASLLDERQAAELREQFIAVLGHDLRNPLAALDAGTRTLMRGSPDERSAGILRLMQSSIKRMAGLIDNVLDFARGRLGGGFVVRREAVALEPTLTQVLEETRSSWPNRTFEVRFDLARPFEADPVRIGQLFSNLLGNAVVHGAEDQPIRVAASTAGDVFELSVANGGEPIPPAALERLFLPFYRGQDRPSLQGLGLGLYIASEIARAHQGTLSVTSTPAETRFTLRIPGSR